MSSSCSCSRSSAVMTRRNCIRSHSLAPCCCTQDGANLCLVLEFCEGRTLNDVRDFCGGVVTEEEAKFYVSEVVAALEFVHTMGFVYRDLKPQNVLVQRDGHIRLVDFGVAQRGDPIEHAADSSSVQQQQQGSQLGAGDRVRLRSCSFVGTVDYMSPEMIQQRPQSSDLDWWALGCLLYELLYGFGPFQDRTCKSTTTTSSHNAVDPAAQFREILKCRVSFPTTPKVSDDCKNLLRTLLTKDPSRRLGHRRGAAEIKQHQFFRGVQWALLGNRSPPVTVSEQFAGACREGSRTGVMEGDQVEELAAVEARLLGSFDSGIWTTHQGVCCAFSPDEVKFEASSPHSLSAYSTGEDTCDEEFDRMVLAADASVSACSQDRCPHKSLTAIPYQRCEQFDRQSTSIFDSMRIQRSSVRQTSATTLFASPATTSSQQASHGHSAKISKPGTSVLKRDVWTLFTSRSASVRA